MQTDNGGVADAVTAELNPDPDAGPAEGAKGPDPAQWGDIANRPVGDYVPSGDGVKGPGPEWGTKSEE